MKIKILISACLLGEAVRYDGKSKPTNHQFIKRWLEEDRLVSVCPEVMGGLSVPREKAEIVGDSVLTESGRDVTSAFKKGAQLAWEIASKSNAQIAILKEKSPSCASKQVYDGSFTGKLVEGKGLSAKLLEEKGIRVFGESQIEELADYLRVLEES